MRALGVMRRLTDPVGTARELHRRARRQVDRARAGWGLRRIPRCERRTCWCGALLARCRWHAAYGVCPSCGCFVNRRPPADLQTLYASQLYWHVMQRAYGYEPIEARGAQYRRDGRLEFWLGLIRRYGPRTGDVLEVGCAPGVLLAALQSQGYRCVGVEPDACTATWMQRTLGVQVRAGLFPGVHLGSCDLFLGFDTLEHSEQPEAFMREMARLLRPGGVAILQTPIERYGYEPPFGEAFESAFKDVEHLFLFTDRAMQLLAARAGLEVVSLEERLWLHHEICVFRKPAQERR